MLDNVQKWITDQGYPLELRTAQMFRAAGFHVSPSSHYIDGESGKQREIDLVAIAPDLVGVTRVYFAIECKSSKKPWVLFTSNAGPGQNILWTYSLMSKKARDVLHECISNDRDNTDEEPYFAMFRKLRWLWKDEQTAHSFRQAFSDTDAAYTALVSSIKAASSLVRIEEDHHFPTLRIAFPVVVIDSPLFLCGLSKTNELETKEVQWGEVLFRNPDNEHAVTCIRIVTLKELPNFVTEARAEIRQLRKEFRTAEEAIWRERFGTEMPDHSDFH